MRKLDWEVQVENKKQLKQNIDYINLVQKYAIPSYSAGRYRNFMYIIER